jgi:hypothetical protein
MTLFVERCWPGSRLLSGLQQWNDWDNSPATTLSCNHCIAGIHKQINFTRSSSKS